MPSELESSWIKHHPNLQASFYQNLEVPKNIKDAELRMQCSRQAVEDIDLQLEIVEQEIALESEQEIPYNETKLDEFREHKLKLMKAKRYQNNSANAYWYYMQVAVG
ncbi:MAG: hypothetical protein GY920_08445 [Aliivibrio sp.]|jgi:hypothetical protein|nr:hypothetical protein [Aliivibrio sp.]